MKVGSLPPVRQRGDIDWGIAFDAVCHIGSGPISHLVRITAQMEATDLFGDSFARRLEALGHIEIERNPSTLQPISWQVNDPMLVGLESGDLVAVGFRSERLIVAIEDEVFKLAGDFDMEEGLDAPPIISMRVIGEEGGRHLANSIEKSTGRSANLIPDAAKNLAASLHPLSQARIGLPTTSALSARTYEAWNPIEARFERTADMSSPGAFRLLGYSRVYVYRRSEDLGLLRATLGDARIVKYLAANDSRCPLVGYDTEQSVLYVPLGADLPGLYGRAATLASGYPPLENLKLQCLEYRHVSPSLAAQLAQLLMT